MPLASLKEVAQSLGLKKVDNLESEDLINSILDHQAEQAAQSAANTTAKKSKKAKTKAEKPQQKTEEKKAEDNNKAEKPAAKKEKASKPKEKAQKKSGSSRSFYIVKICFTVLTNIILIYCNMRYIQHF